MPPEHRGTLANDSDVYKVIEEAAYSLQHHPDSELEAYVDKLINRIIAAQQPVGKYIDSVTGLPRRLLRLSRPL